MRFISHRSLLFSKLKFPEKDFSILTAHMGFLFFVSSLVFGELELLGEGFPTHTTSMVFLSCMNSLMFIEPTFLDEGFSTFGTFTGILYFAYLLTFNFSMYLLMISKEKGSPIANKLSRLPFVTSSTLVDYI